MKLFKKELTTNYTISIQEVEPKKSTKTIMVEYCPLIDLLSDLHEISKTMPEGKTYVNIRKRVGQKFDKGISFTYNGSNIYNLILQQCNQ